MFSPKNIEDTSSSPSQNQRKQPANFNRVGRKVRKENEKSTTTSSGPGSTHPSSEAGSGSQYLSSSRPSAPREDTVENFHAFHHPVAGRDLGWEPLEPIPPASSTLRPWTQTAELNAPAPVPLSHPGLSSTPHSRPSPYSPTAPPGGWPDLDGSESKAPWSRPPSKAGPPPQQGPVTNDANIQHDTAAPDVDVAAHSRAVTNHITNNYYGAPLAGQPGSSAGDDGARIPTPPPSPERRASKTRRGRFGLQSCLLLLISCCCSPYIVAPLMALGFVVVLLYLACLAISEARNWLLELLTLRPLGSPGALYDSVKSFFISAVSNGSSTQSSPSSLLASSLASSASFSSLTPSITPTPFFSGPYSVVAEPVSAISSHLSGISSQFSAYSTHTDANVANAYNAVAKGLDSPGVLDFPRQYSQLGSLAGEVQANLSRDVQNNEAAVMGVLRTIEHWRAGRRLRLQQLEDHPFLQQEGKGWHQQPSLLSRLVSLTQFLSSPPMDPTEAFRFAAGVEDDQAERHRVKLRRILREALSARKELGKSFPRLLLTDAESQQVDVLAALCELPEELGNARKRFDSHLARSKNKAQAGRPDAGGKALPLASSFWFGWLRGSSTSSRNGGREEEEAVAAEAMKKSATDQMGRFVYDLGHAVDLTDMTCAQVRVIKSHISDFCTAGGNEIKYLHDLIKDLDENPSPKFYPKANRPLSANEIRMSIKVGEEVMDRWDKRMEERAKDYIKIMSRYM